MNPKSKITLTSLLILFVALTRAMAQFTYSAVDLGTLGGPTSTANSIDPSGEVSGFSLTADGSGHAFFYINGTINDLGTLGGVMMIDPTTGNQNGALGSNALGQVVGFGATSDGSIHAFAYANGQMVDLNTITNLSPAGFKVLTVAKAINDSSLIVGDGIMTTGDRHAFLLVPVGAATQGAPAVIPTKGGQWSYANDQWVWTASDGGWGYAGGGWQWNRPGKPPTHHPHTPPPPPPPPPPMPNLYPGIPPKTPALLKTPILTPIGTKLTPPAPTPRPPWWRLPNGPPSPSPQPSQPRSWNRTPGLGKSPTTWQGTPAAPTQPPTFNKTPFLTPGIGKSPITSQLTSPAPSQPPASPAPSATAQPTRGPILPTPTPGPHRHRAMPLPTAHGPKPSPTQGEQHEQKHHHP